jgi:NAD binding domain of 6-phosphogluconate dehydrogenase
MYEQQRENRRKHHQFQFLTLTILLCLLSARLDRINIGGHVPAPHVQPTDNGPRGDFGLIGLAVMGQNLILNAADHGYKVIAFNRTVSKVDHFLANEAKGKPQNCSV